MAVYRDEKRGTWFANLRYRDWEGNPRRKTKRGFATRREAEEWERNFRSEASGSPGMPLGRAYEVYMRDVEDRLRATTIATKRNMLERWVLPYFGDAPLSSITPKKVMDWGNWLYAQRTAKGTCLAPTYMNSISSQLSALMNHFVRYYRLPSNPVAVAGRVGKKESRGFHVWTREQYLAFSDAVADKPYAHLAFELLFWCGIREGEMLALTPGDFDLGTSTVSVTKSYARSGGADYVLGPKTPASRRRVTMPLFLAEEVEEYLAANPSIPEGQRVFAGMTKSLLTHEMARGSRAAGVPRIRVHDLRHSYATMLVQMGFPITAIAARLGHSCERATYLYVHALPESDRAIASALDSDAGNSRG